MAASGHDDDLAGDDFLLREAPPDAPAHRARRVGLALLALALLTAVASAADEQRFAWQAPLLVAPSSLAPDAATGYTLAAVSCSSASLCVAVADGGYALTTTAPAAGGDAWTPRTLSPDPLRSVACPTTSLCVGVDDGGSVVTSTHPADGIGAWDAAPIDAANAPLTALACPSRTLCVAADGFGNVVTSRDPTGGTQAWRLANVDGAHPLVALACPTTALCVALDREGNSVVSHDPASGPGAWSVNGNIGRTFPTALACPTADRCVAAAGRDVVVSDDPGGRSPDWRGVRLGDLLDLSDLACPSIGFCVGVDGRGFALTGTDRGLRAGRYVFRVRTDAPSGPPVRRNFTLP
jgi:hypothetical protein